MWLYLNKNQDNYRFALSRVDCAEWGIRKDSYYDGIKDLIANGYLRQSQPGSNLYIFYENALTENPTSGYSEFYFTEKSKPATEIQKSIQFFQILPDKYQVDRILNDAEKQVRKY